MHHDDGSRGLPADLRLMRAMNLNRRRLLGLLAGASALPLIGCDRAASGDTDGDAAGPDATTGADAARVESCAAIPQETGGPYPADGTNGADALALAGILRSDIRASIGGATGVAAGVPLTVTLTLVDVGNGCAPLADHAVYLWHCDRGGAYSMYSGAAAGENYLRGVQASDANGQLTFVTVFPGCYAGRWPHVHFEVFASVARATRGSNALRTSQLALPVNACNAAYATAGYEASVRNLGMVSLASDMVFSDGATLQLPTITGDATAGYTAALVVGVQT